MLRGLGTLGVIGTVGATTLTGSAAALNTSFNASSPNVIRNDRGEVTEVSVDPRVYTRWENLDEEPGKLRFILEAGIDGVQPFAPVYRETPFLNSGSESYGTTDRYPGSGRVPLATKNSDFYNINSNGDFVSPDDGSQQVPPKIVLFKDGLSTYRNEAADYPDAGGGTGEQHFTGASLGDDAGDYANGNYGVLGNTDAFDVDEDGSTGNQTVRLRLYSVLLKDNSESIMQEEYPAYSGSAGYTYQRLRNIASDNPIVNISTAQFTVSTENEAADSGSGGNANPIAN